MGERAQPRHYNDLASASKRKYGYDFRHYESAARVAAIPVYAPGAAFLESYLEGEAHISLDRAARRMWAIGYAFWKQGLPDPTLDLPIRRQIHAIRVQDREERLDVLGIVPSAAKHYAGYYIGDRFAAATAACFEQRGRCWELWAVRHGVDPKGPAGAELFAFVRTFEDTSFGNLRNVVRALQWYFTSRDLHDVTRLPEIKDLLEKVRRKPTDSVSPLFVPDLRRIVAGFGVDRLDKRDRLLTLFGFFGPIQPVSQSRLVCEDLVREKGGLTVFVNGRELFFDPLPDDPSLDVVSAYDAYVASVKWREGAFFRSLGLRGEYLPQMSPGAISAAIKNAGRRAGIQAKSVADGLMRGFRIEAVKLFGTIVTARRLGYKDPASLAIHSAQARADVEQVRRRGPRWRGTKQSKRRAKH